MWVDANDVLGLSLRYRWFKIKSNSTLPVIDFTSISQSRAIKPFSSKASSIRTNNLSHYKTINDLYRKPINVPPSPSPWNDIIHREIVAKTTRVTAEHRSFAKVGHARIFRESSIRRRRDGLFIPRVIHHSGGDRLARICPRIIRKFCRTEPTRKHEKQRKKRGCMYCFSSHCVTSFLMSARVGMRTHTRVMYFSLRRHWHGHINKSGLMRVSAWSAGKTLSRPSPCSGHANGALRPVHNSSAQINRLGGGVNCPFCSLRFVDLSSRQSILIINEKVGHGYFHSRTKGRMDTFHGIIADLNHLIHSKRAGPLGQKKKPLGRGLAAQNQLTDIPKSSRWTNERNAPEPRASQESGILRPLADSRQDHRRAQRTLPAAVYTRE